MRLFMLLALLAGALGCAGEAGAQIPAGGNFGACPGAAAEAPLRAAGRRCQISAGGAYLIELPDGTAAGRLEVTSGELRWHWETPWPTSFRLDARSATSSTSSTPIVTKRQPFPTTASSVTIGAAYEIKHCGAVVGYLVLGTSAHTWYSTEDVDWLPSDELEFTQVSSVGWRTLWRVVDALL